jgi:hypothetical protein
MTMTLLRSVAIATCIAVTALSLSAFGGCATTAARNPQQTVLQLRADYTVAVEAASTYGDPAVIPLCSDAAPQVKLCAKPAIVKQIKLAKDVAKPLIDNAEASVLDPSFNASEAQAIIVSAQNALKALQSINDALSLKAPTKTSLIGTSGRPLAYHSLVSATPNYAMPIAAGTIGEGIALLEQLLALFPLAVGFVTRWRNDLDVLKQLQADKGDDYVPTAEDFAPYDQRSAAAEAKIDENAARAAGESNNG